MIQNQDLKELIRKNMLDEYIEKIANLLHSANLVNTPIYLNFIKSIKCLSCESRCQIILNCDHQYCEKCLKNFSAKTNLTSTGVYLCPSCPVPSNPSVQSSPRPAQLYKEETTSSPLRRASSHISENLTCQVCHLVRPKDKFYYSCNHMCIYCGCKMIQTKKSCVVCNSNVIHQEWKFSSKEIECAGCKGIKSMFENRIFDVCNDHPHCSKCLYKVWGTMKCMGCQQFLGLKERKALQAHLFTQCGICKNLLEDKFILEKRCNCDPVCIGCQTINGKDNCIKCGTKFSEKTIKRIKVLDRL